MNMLTGDSTEAVTFTWNLPSEASSLQCYLLTHLLFRQSLPRRLSRSSADSLKHIVFTALFSGHRNRPFTHTGRRQHRSAVVYQIRPRSLSAHCTVQKQLLNTQGVMKRSHAPCSMSIGNSDVGKSNVRLSSLFPASGFHRWRCRLFSNGSVLVREVNLWSLTSDNI